MAKGIGEKVSRFFSESPALAGVKRLVLQTALGVARCWDQHKHAGAPGALRRPAHLPSLCEGLNGGASLEAAAPLRAVVTDAKEAGERGRCTVIVRVHNDLAAVRPCLQSLAECGGIVRLVLVNDGSDQHTARFLYEFASEHEWAEVLRPQWPLGAVRGLNTGMEAVKEGDIVLLDCRTLVTPGWLERLVDCARRSRAVLITPLSNTATEVWVRSLPGESYLETASRLAEAPAEGTIPVSFPDEGCLYVRGEVYRAIGGLDETFTEPSYAFLDYTLRAREAGYETVCCTSAFVFHPAVPFAVNEEDAARLRQRAGARIPVTAQNTGLDEFRRTGRRAESGPSIRREDARWHYHETFNTILGESGLDADIKTYRERLDTFLKKKPVRPERPRVVFLLNRLQRSGGVISVAQLVNDLILLGVDAKLVVHSARGFDPEISLLTEPLFFRDQRELIDRFPQADLVVGTFWNTAYAVMKVFLKRGDFVPAYFVQDFEPAFIPENRPRLREACKNTYRFMPNCFAKTPWICEKVRGCGGTISLVPPALDLDLFYPREVPPNMGLKRILTMLRPSTPRRGFHTALATFNKLAEERNDFEVHSFGSSDAELAHFTIKFPLINHGRVPNHQLPALYSRAWCFAEFSSFHGFGRTVAEAFACGIPAVVTESGGTGFFCRSDVNCLTAKPDDVEALSAHVSRLLDDTKLHARLAAGCRDSVRGFDRVESARETLRFLMSAFE